MFDLDETLVRVEFKEPAYDYTVQAMINDEESMYITMRPHIKETLAELAKHFEIVLFTAATEDYAQIVIKCMEVEEVIPENFFSMVLDRSFCTHI